ncbi:hypothetical protein EVAR_4639_1 [Eumeta japonica]|uniref:Uncharacterized protein n=1 Tax=Eumeta variegata TaxID=151549 RepID=A0A4C1SX40_EUMVA|nr:hypothetical protein EVAR_4639_1 [Eumeta japonica]
MIILPIINIQFQYYRHPKAVDQLTARPPHNHAYQRNAAEFFTAKPDRNGVKPSSWGRSKHRRRPNSQTTSDTVCVLLFDDVRRVY